jgi:transposase InsO family protein
MTAFSFNGLYFEVTFFFDVFTKEILTYRIAPRRGSRSQYIDGLEDVRKLLIDDPNPVIIHTDHGSVYTSSSFNKLFVKSSKFIRSMSRVGKPGDNPVNESLNGWIKEELFIDFKLKNCENREQFALVIEKYVDFYNNMRPCWAIGYNIPSKYKKMFDDGLLEKRNTFEHRILSEIPKFVQKRLKKEQNQ